MERRGFRRSDRMNRRIDTTCHDRCPFSRLREKVPEADEGESCETVAWLPLTRACGATSPASGRGEGGASRLAPLLQGDASATIGAWSCLRSVVCSAVRRG